MMVGGEHVGAFVSRELELHRLHIPLEVCSGC